MRTTISTKGKIKRKVPQGKTLNNKIKTQNKQLKCLYLANYKMFALLRQTFKKLKIRSLSISKNSLMQ